MDLTISNITATVNMQTSINLQSVTNAYNRQCRYNPSVFVGMAFKMKAPKLTFIIHSSGKVNVVGAKKVRSIEYGVRKLAKLLGKISIAASPTQPCVRNMVLKGVYSYKVNPTTLKEFCPQRVTYEPEMFHGIHYRVSGACVSLFSSGRFYITGVKTVQQANSIATELERILENINNNP